MDITDYIKTKIDDGKDFAFRIKAVGEADATLRTSAQTEALYQPTILLHKTTTSIIEMNKIGDITVYPNPASSTVTISGIEPGSEINILNVAGAVVKNLIATSNLEVIDVNDLTKGIYLVKVGDATQKLVVK